MLIRIGNKYRALIDKKDYPKVKDYSWGRCTGGYAFAVLPRPHIKRKIILMHQLIIGIKKVLRYTIKMTEGLIIVGEIYVI